MLQMHRRRKTFQSGKVPESTIKVGFEEGSLVRERQLEMPDRGKCVSRGTEIREHFAYKADEELMCIKSKCYITIVKSLGCWQRSGMALILFNFKIVFIKRFILDLNGESQKNIKW